MSNDRFAVSVKDAAGAYVRANDAFIALLGVEPDDLPGLRDDEVQPRDVAGALATNDRAALAASGPLLVEEQVCDRIGRRHVAACRFVTAEDGRALLWRVSGPPEHAAEVAAEAERLRLAVGAGAPADPSTADRERTRERIGRLEASLAEARSLAALPDPRSQAALRALAGVAEVLREPLEIAPACRAVAQRLAGALSFDAAVTWRPARMGGVECSSVWTGPALSRDFEDSCWHRRRAPVEELTWESHADEPHGMRTIVTIALAHGGAIELFAQDSREPEPETLLALEAATHQLAIVHRLTQLARQPRWETLALPS
jgi:hypothetical protein